MVALGTPPRVRDLRLGPVPHPDRRFYPATPCWYLHLYNYSATLAIDGREFALGPGSVSLIPPGSAVTFTWPHAGNVHLYAHLEMDPAAGDARPIPLVSETGRAFPRLWSGMQEAIALHPRQPRAAQARIWDLLWQIAGLVPADAAGEDPLVTRTLIALSHGGAAIRAVDLAREAGVSSDTLNRRFRAAVGLGVKAYMQRELSRRIVSLLQDHGLPPVAAARELQCPNLHAFNKLVRRLCGASPTALHRSAQRGSSSRSRGRT